jgi:hypothetical protein
MDDVIIRMMVVDELRVGSVTLKREPPFKVRSYSAILLRAVRAGYGCAADDLPDNAARLGAAFGLHGYIAAATASGQHIAPN